MNPSRSIGDRDRGGGGEQKFRRISENQAFTFRRGRLGLVRVSGKSDPVLGYIGALWMRCTSTPRSLSTFAIDILCFFADHPSLDSHPSTHAKMLGVCVRLLWGRTRVAAHSMEHVSLNKPKTSVD